MGNTYSQRQLVGAYYYDGDIDTVRRICETEDIDVNFQVFPHFKSLLGDVCDNLQDYRGLIAVARLPCFV
jgi:hypothetical protein